MAPIAFHDAIALDQQLAAQVFAKIAVVILEGVVAAVFGQEPGENLAGAAEAVVFGNIGADDRRGLGQAIAGHDQDADIFEENLQFEIKGSAAADDAAELAAKSLAEFAEDHRVVESVVGQHPEDAAVKARAGGENAGSVVDRLVNQGLDFGRLAFNLPVDAEFDRFHDAGNRRHEARLK